MWLESVRLDNPHAPLVFASTNKVYGHLLDNGAFVPRLRLFWVDVTKDKWEFLAGQSWSMLTPNRKGISALPGRRAKTVW